MSHDETTPEPVERHQPQPDPNFHLGPGANPAGLDATPFEQPILDRIIEGLNDG
jgi:hypothetical protein